MKNLNKKRLFIGLSIYMAFMIGLALLWVHFYQNMLPKDLDVNIRAIWVIVGVGMFIVLAQLLPKVFVPWIVRKKEETDGTD